MANEHYADEFYDKAARAAISAAIVNQKANVCPFTIRLAWHASGTYDAADGTGGSDGATMRFSPEINDDANAGLALMQDILQPVRVKFPDLSIADLWTMAGTQAIKLMGGPDIPFRCGRTDAADASACPAIGRLPDAKQGAEHLRAVFGRMGFGDRDIVALSGAHTVGSCHKLRSGFDGPWTTNPLKFDNEYFKVLLERTWIKKPESNPEQFMDQETGKLMMLPTDMCLIHDEGFLPHVKAYAADESLFFRDFAEAFGRLISLGCPEQCQMGAVTAKEKALTGAASSDDKDFRDLAMHGSVDRMQQVMLKGHVNVNSTEPHSGRTAAHKAAFFGHDTVITYLAGLNGVVVDWDAVDSDGDTSLHDASRFGHVNVVKALLAAGANCKVRNKAGKMPLDVATDYGKDAVVQLLSQ
jgi:Peroxidase/Ankyrin repeats (3 copies)